MTRSSGSWVAALSKTVRCCAPAENAANLRVLLAFFGLLLFPANSVFAVTMTFQREASSEGKWPWFNSEQQEVRSMAYRAAIQSFLNNSVDSEPGTEPVSLKQGDLVGKEYSGKSNLTNAGKVSRLPSVLRSFKFLRLLILMFMVVAGSKMLPARKADLRPDIAERVTGLQGQELGQFGKEELTSVQPPQTPEIAAENSVAKMRARLEKIKKLLPAAYRLASAVDSEASWRLLEKLRMAVADEAELAEGAKGCSTVETSLSNALTALDWLHKVAFQRADELVQAARSLPPFPSLGQQGEEIFRLVRELEQQSELHVVDALLKTYYALDGGAAALEQQLHDGERLILLCRASDNKEDENTLLVIANALKFLRETSKSQSRLIDVANSFSKDIFFGLKEIILENCNELVRKTERSLEAVLLYAALWRPEITYSTPAKAPPSFKENTGIHFDQLRKETSEVQSFVKRLFSLRQLIIESTTPADVCSAYLKARDIETQAFSKIEECWLTATSFPLHYEDLDTQDIQLVVEKGERALKSLTVDSEFLSKAVENLQIAAVGLNQLANKEAIPTFSEAVIKEQLSIMKKIAANVKGRIDSSQSSINALKKATCLVDVMAEIFHLNEHRRSQERDKTAAAFLNLSSRFLEFLKEDTENATSQVFCVAKQMSVREIPKYKELEKLFNAAKMSFQKAATLQEAAEAAANMRTHANVIRTFLLAPDTKDF